MKIAFIGLGVMGFPMAAHLARQSGSITVYNRTATKAHEWANQHGGGAAPSSADAGRGADLVFLCVGNDDDVRTLVSGAEGIASVMNKGGIIIDHSTISADTSREMSRYCTSAGCSFIDAPVSGGQQGAENGKLTVMCGGDESAFRKAEPYIRAYAREVQLMGPSGAGQLTKMVNQICIAGLIQSLAEGLNFAQKAGLDAHKVISVLSKGAGQSWQMENRHATMLAGEYNHGFAVRHMLKDLSICLDEAERNGAQLPIAALVDQFYKRVSANGGANWDTSALMTLLT